MKYKKQSKKWMIFTLSICSLFCLFIHTTKAEETEQAKGNITLNQYNMHLYVGKTFRLKATISNHAKETITFVSNQPKVAAINAKGVITAKKQGTATIQAKTNSGLSASCIVFVHNYSLNYKKATIYTGDKLTLRVNGPVSKVKWSIVKGKKYISLKKGTITGKKAGKAVVMAKFSKKKLKATIKVKRSKPEISVKCSKKYNTDCTKMQITITNLGTKELVVTNKGTTFEDPGSEFFNRELQLTDKNSQPISSVKIQPQKSVTVFFSVIGSSTWYDTPGRIHYQFKYANYTYRATSGYEYGTKIKLKK